MSQEDEQVTSILENFRSVQSQKWEIEEEERETQL